MMQEKDAFYAMHDSYMIHDTWTKITGFWAHDSYIIYRIQITGYRLQDTDYRIQIAGYRVQDTGYR